MVNMSVKLIYSMLFMLLISNTLYAKGDINTSRLFLYSDKNESELGRPLRVEIYGIALKSKISNLKLSALNEKFGVEIDHIINNTSDKRWPNQSIQILKLKLYPRKSGKLIIPNLSINKIQSKKKVIFITGKDTSKHTISSTSPYERQQIISHFTVITSDSSARLSINDESFVHGFDSAPLRFKRTKNTDGTYTLQIGWSLSAVKSGETNLELPPIDYSVSGVARKKYYLPLKKISIKALPLYISPTTPVGNIEISSDTENKSVFKIDSLSYWKIKIKGALNNTYNLPPVLRQIKSNTQFKFLPVNSKRYIEKTEINLFSTVEHSIPFKSLNSGLSTLPNIKIQYFDPVDKKLKTIIHRTNTIFILGNFWRTIISIIFFILLFYFSRKSYTRLQRYIYSKNKREEAITRLQGNDNTNIRGFVTLIAESEFWPKNITLSQWAVFWENKYQVNNNYDVLMGILSDNMYSKKSSKELKELQSQLIDLVSSRKRIKKSFL